MERYFNINYEFDKVRIFTAVDKQLQRNAAGYICVADGVILNIVNRDPEYMHVVNSSMFSICDSGYVPIYLRWIYGIKCSQYTGSDIFMDFIHQKKYRMFFMGASQKVLDGLQANLSKIDKRINDMTFYELPFCDVEDFDYPLIARMIEEDGAEIIWLALGAPKQEIFMNRLQPYLQKGVMIAIGAAFKFYSGCSVRRAPKWVVNIHAEFIYRIFSEPKKQIRRCAMIIYTLPSLLYNEWRKKHFSHSESFNREVKT